MKAKDAAKKYTIKDVAREAEVGVGTVSRVLNGDPNVKGATRQRVLEVIAQVGYQPSFSARSLRTQKSSTVGLIADAVATTPYAVNVIKGAQAEAWRRGKLLLVVDADNDQELRERAFEMMLEREVEGVVYAAMFHQEVSLSEQFRQLPTVLVDCFDKDAAFSSCVPDEVQGGRDATRELVKKKHRRIALILNTPLASPYPASKGRFEGYRQALEEVNVAVDPVLVREGDGDAVSGFDQTLELMKLAAPPTALFCATDRMAMGAYDALKSLGLQIPQDVSVVGFDNQDVIAEQLYPPLSTMALPHAAMGRWAVDFLLRERPDTLQETLPCPFVERASVAYLKA